MERRALAKTLFSNKTAKPDYRLAPLAIFSQPPIGQVEEQALKEYGDVDVYTVNFRPLKATLSGLPDHFMKFTACAKTTKVLGLHLWRRCTRNYPGICCCS